MLQYLHTNRKHRMKIETAAEVLATVKVLEARARKVPKPARNAYHQIAKRRIADARLFADKNLDHAIACIREARHCLELIVY